MQIIHEELNRVQKHQRENERRGIKDDGLKPDKRTAALEKGETETTELEFIFFMIGERLLYGRIQLGCD